jgi:hypothetical protein
LVKHAYKGRFTSEFEFCTDINVGTISKGDYMIANSGHDEKNKYRNGRAGDQTGGEYAVIPSVAWTLVIRDTLPMILPDA